MQLVAPDILADACGLSVGLIIIGIILGLALWLFGWSCHRFWIVLITTVLAGIYGLYDASERKHKAIRAAFEAEPGLVIIPMPVLSEIDYLLRKKLGIDAEACRG